MQTQNHSKTCRQDRDGLDTRNIAAEVKRTVKTMVTALCIKFCENYQGVNKKLLMVSERANSFEDENLKPSLSHSG